MSGFQKTTFQPENGENEEICPQVGSTEADQKELFFPPNDQWKKSLSQSFRSLEKLFDFLQLNIPQDVTADKDFPLLVTHSFASRMKKGEVKDPLLQQILPIKAEMEISTEKSDAVGDLQAKRAPGVIHKYHGRVLLILSPVCAIHCRYCFRKHYPYQDDPHTLADWEQVFATLKDDQSIEEVILSGGDPLMLSDRRLMEIISMIEALPQVQRLRIHSRLPIVLPDRVNKPLINMLLNSRLTPMMVVHANHPNEIAGDCSHALQRLVRLGITTLNQAVLLKSINDDVMTLTNLCQRLINLGVIPYYLHQRDAVAGTAHFEVPVERGLELIRELEHRLPGYAVPKYVREIEGELSKVRIS